VGQLCKRALGEQSVTSGGQVPLRLDICLVEMIDGMWCSISYVPKMMNVMFGNNGGGITLVKAKDGTWWLGDALSQNSAGSGLVCGFGGNRFGPWPSTEQTVRQLD